MSKFFHDDTKAIAMPQVFSENSRAKNCSMAYPKQAPIL